MVNNNIITVKDVNIRTMKKDGVDYICITDIARQRRQIKVLDEIRKERKRTLDRVNNHIRIKDICQQRIYRNGQPSIYRRRRT